MRVRYSGPAAVELTELLDYITERSPQGAGRVLRRIQEVERHISRFPRLGTKTHDPALRAMFTSPYPYVILYEERQGEILIHRIRHAARQR